MRKYTTKMLQNQKESCRLLTTSAFLTIAPKIERFPSENQMIIHLKVSMIFALSFRWFLPLVFDNFRLEISIIFALSFRWLFTSKFRSFSPWIFDDFASENDNIFIIQEQWSILIKPNIYINFPSTKHWFLQNEHYICRANKFRKIFFTKHNQY